jgi:hypothetical protein
MRLASPEPVSTERPPGTPPSEPSGFRALIADSVLSAADSESAGEVVRASVRVIGRVAQENKELAIGLGAVAIIGFAGYALWRTVKGGNQPKPPPP